MADVFDKAAFAKSLLAQQQEYGIVEPVRLHAERFIRRTLATLFPHFNDITPKSSEEYVTLIDSVEVNLRRALQPLIDESKVTDAVAEFMAKLPALHKALLKDAEAINLGDPAAESLDEVLHTYPGFLAIAVYRIAHTLAGQEIPLLPRTLTEFAHHQTGIDIHPNAKIGRSFCIDHGTGIVIGATTVIHDNVRIYQGVTLGGLVVKKNLAGKKRHPTIEENVVIYANATILGGDTIIGKNSIIGGNVWITSSVPPGSRVYHEEESRRKESSGVKI